MIDLSPRWMMIIGFALMVLGVILPILMIMKILESTFFLNLLSYMSSFFGVILGITGTIFYVVRNRNR